MPVIKCPECGQVVLDRLNKCPNCGKQIPMSVRYPNFYDNNSTENNYNTGGYGSQNSYKKEEYQNGNYAPPYQENLPNNPVKAEEKKNKVSCPKCGGTNITYQREQTASIGAGTNKVVVQKAKKSHGCLYWLCIGWWLLPMYWLLIGWWWKPLFGGRTKGGLNFNANKTINRTMAICQNCGHSWKV